MLKRHITRFIAMLGLCAPLCLALLLSACLTEGNQQQNGSPLAGQMHAAMQAQDWDAVLPLYSEGFFVGSSRQAWGEKLASMHQRFGALQQISQTFEQRAPRLGGVFYYYGFKLKYERGVVHETLTVFKKDDGEEAVVTGQLFKFKDKVL